MFVDMSVCMGITVMFCVSTVVDGLTRWSTLNNSKYTHSLTHLHMITPMDQY